MQWVYGSGSPKRLLSKPIIRIAMVLCIGLLFPLVTLYLLGEMNKEDHLRKELDALSFRSITPYKETLEELFRNIDQNTLAFTNTKAVQRIAQDSGNLEVEQGIKEAHREMAELATANCCDSSIEIYYHQAGLSTSLHNGQQTAVRMEAAAWESYKSMMADKVHWFVDEAMTADAGYPVISFVRPIPSVGNQPQGLIKINFNPSLFQFGFRLPEGQSIWAVTPDGKRMFDLITGKAVTDTRIVDALKRQSPSSAIVKENGQLYGYRLFSSPATGWSFMLRLPPTAFTPANSGKWLVYAASLLLTLAASLYVLLNFSQIARRVDALIHKEVEYGSKMKELLPTVRQHGLQKLLFSGLLSEEDGRHTLRELDVPLAPHGYLVAIIRIEEYERFLQYSYRDQSLFRFFLTKASEEIAEREGQVLYVYDTGQRDVALLFIFEDRGTLPISEKARSLADHLDSTLRQYVPFRISAAIGSPCEAANRIHVSCQHALQTLDVQLFKGNTGVFAYEEQAEDPIYSSELYRLRKETEQHLGKAILSRNRELLGKALEQLQMGLEKLPWLSLPLVQHTFWELTMFIYLKVQEADHKPINPLLLPKLHAERERHKSLSTIVKWCHKLADSMLEELQAPSESGKVNVISKIIDYVHTNFDKEISLGGIAQQLGLDMAYVSRCFKQEVGMTFMDYLLMLRLKHAKYLLANPDLTVGEIGEAVGYVNVNSFIRIFKKHEGVTPGQYREQNFPRELDSNQIY
ncbi:helix-turn-helix domain-containing protein [Paenibacillus sp. NPDC056579]|uniref:helix-turn-helix domain-containing protein n=1 Tax=Paenibacillus sp. NPDC056579 TaxID=3345871 RepID=UPI0036C9A6D2